MSDLQWTVVKLQQMLAERNSTECDASKRDAEYAACRIANESLVHDLTRVMDERDRLQAEVQRLQGEVRQAQTGHDCALVAAYESGLRAGQEAMRERCASSAARDADGACSCGRPICQPDCARVRLLDLADAIRALEVER